MKFHDAAIGGTGSQLSVFRLDRDVLARRPGPGLPRLLGQRRHLQRQSRDAGKLRSHLSGVWSKRRACPVVQVIFPFKWNVARKTTDGMKRRDAHLAISRAYQTAVGDAIALAIARVGCGSHFAGRAVADRWRPSGR